MLPVGQSIRMPLCQLSANPQPIQASTQVLLVPELLLVEANRGRQQLVQPVRLPLVQLQLTTALLARRPASSLLVMVDS